MGQRRSRKQTERRRKRYITGMKVAKESSQCSLVRKKNASKKSHGGIKERPEGREPAECPSRQKI